MVRIGDLLGEQAAPGLEPGPDFPRPDRAAEEYPDPSTDGKGGHRRRGALLVAGVLVAGTAIVVVATWLGVRSAPAPRAALPSQAGSSTPAGTAAGVPGELAATQSIAVPPPISASLAAPGLTVPSGENQSDPFLLRDQDRYYLYTSGVPGRLPINVPVATATDFRGWSPVTDAMPVLPHWARPGFTWAPDVHRFGSATVLYFTAGVAGSGQQCVGIATATSPLGPFTAEPTPFLCQTALGGTIDPRVFTDATGVNWMLYKSDQNIGGAATPTVMWSQRLSPDGVHLVGPPFRLMGPDEPWQGTIVEAPDMVQVGRTYWLVYSGNWFNQPDYAIGAARCAGPSGPCADISNRPVLGSNAQGAGPGEASLYTDETGSWLLYTPVMESWGSGPRPVMVARIGFGPDGAYLAAGGPPPTIDPLAASSLWLSS
jgi:hypothetical protein